MLGKIKFKHTLSTYRTPRLTPIRFSPRHGQFRYVLCVLWGILASATIYTNTIKKHKFGAQHLFDSS
jgi:hypothetical protein